jgi:hypothetical protein
MSANGTSDFVSFGMAEKQSISLGGIERMPSAYEKSPDYGSKESTPFEHMFWIIQ